ncbi:hypothetical protein D1814_00500 [Alteromonas sp. BL110]|nr:hypothetical protein D1814_00500 [Alteromonas sp. BL110]
MVTLHLNKPLFIPILAMGYLVIRAYPSFFLEEWYRNLIYAYFNVLKGYSVIYRFRSEFLFASIGVNRRIPINALKP